MALSPRDSSLWISKGERLLHLDEHGKVLGVTRVGEPVSDVALSADGNLWALGENNLFEVNAKGRVASKRNIPSYVEDSGHLTIDGSRNYAWIGGSDRVVRVKLEGPGEPALTRTLNGNETVEGLTSDPRRGRAYVASERQLSVYGPDGKLLNRVSLRPYGIEQIQDLTFDAPSNSLWLAHKNTLVRFTGSGTVIKKFDSKNDITAVGTSPYVASAESTQDSSPVIQPQALTAVETGVVSTIDSLDKAMASYALFNNDNYNGITEAELRSWGYARTNGVNVVIRITNGGKHYNATGQSITAGREFSFTTGPGNFNGVPPRTEGEPAVSVPQPPQRATFNGTEIWYDLGRPDKQGKCENDNPCQVADPVNVATGNMYEHREDLSIPARGLPLSFERTYNSQDDYQGPLGYGWTHSYNVNLKANADGSVTQTTPDGKRLVYKRNADASYATPKGFFDKLTKNADGTYTLRKQDGIEWIFGADGKLRSVRDLNGNALALSYDAGGKLARITDPVGRELTFSYDGSGRMATITDPIGRTVTYGYSAAGDLVSVTDPFDQVRRYEYNAQHNMTAIVDPPDPGAPAGATGLRTTFTYDDQDRASSYSGDGGFQKVEMFYGAGYKTWVKDSKGNVSTYIYDADGKVTRIVDPLGNNLSYTWDAGGNMASETDQLGNTTTMSYDAAGNLTQIVEPKANPADASAPTTRVTYDLRFNKPASVTDPGGGVASYVYDTKGNLTSATDTLNNTTNLTYNAFGQLTRSTDAKNRSWTFAYDSVRGNLTEVTDPDLKKTTYTYDGVGRVVTDTDARNNTTTIAYDALDRIKKVTHPASPTASVGTPAPTTQYAYDALGRTASVTDENNNTVTAKYNPGGRPLEVVDALLNKTTFAYDTEGNLISVTDPKNKTTTMKYDALTRLTEVTRPDGTTNPDGTAGTTTVSYGYDAAGRQTSSVDATGQKTTYGYDNRGRMTGVTDLAADGTTVLQRATYEYDWAGRVTRATNPNNHATTYAYDKLGRLLEETDPLGNVSMYSYDAVGNMTGRTDAERRRTAYAYDALDRPLSSTYPDGTKLTATYDAVGNLLSATNPNGTMSFAYDERNRLVQETLSGGRVVKQEYDAAGNRTAFVYPDGKKTLYAYDAANRLKSVTDRESAKTNYTYDELGRPTDVKYPSGAGDAYAYDPLGRVTSATASGPTGTTLHRLDYAYNKNGDATSIVENGQNNTYTYDALDRIKSETHPGGPTLSYAYDAAGNRTSMTTTPAGGTATTTDYTYDAAEQMTRAGNETFAYDRNGQMVSRTQNGATTRYAYDFEGRLTSSGNVGYERDALGRVASTKRLATPLATNPTGGSFEPKSFLYDGSEAAQETDQAGTPTYLTRGLGGGITNRRVGATGSPSYFHHDKNGSVVTLTGSTGAKTDTYSYDGFGNVLSKTGTTKNSYLYLENSFEPSTGLYDAHARAYDPKNGRFTSEDPVKGVSSLPETLNPYPCSINNPISYPDPGGAFSPEVNERILDAIMPQIWENVRGHGEIGDGEGYYQNGRVSKSWTEPVRYDEIKSDDTCGKDTGQVYELLRDNARAPDYYQFDASWRAPLPFPTGAAGGSINLKVDRYGNWNPGGSASAKMVPGDPKRWPSVTLTANWINQCGTPSTSRVNDYLSAKPSASAKFAGTPGPAATYTQVPGQGSSTGAGVSVETSKPFKPGATFDGSFSVR